MTKKSISTNVAAVACDVCGRTLLRGEHADVFLHGGERRTVCELCTVRAVHEGWIREGVDHIDPRAAAGRGRTLLGRLRQRRGTRDGVEPRPVADEPLYDPSTYDPEHYVAPVEPAPPAPMHTPAPAPAPVPVGQPAEHEPAIYEPRNVHAVPSNSDLKVARALEVFNASQHRRTVAGVARSLGAPIVAALPSTTEGAIVSITVAWELSWYRYEVDLGDEASGARVVAQGMELDELSPPERVPNATADESGALHPGA